MLNNLKLSFAAVLFLFVGCAMFFMSYHEWQQHEKFSYAAIPSEGEILRYERESQWDAEYKKNVYIYIPVVRIITSEGKVFDDRTLPRDESLFPVGSKLKLKYLLQDPPVVEYNDSASYSYMPYLFAVVGAMFFGCGILMFRL